MFPLPELPMRAEYEDECEALSMCSDTVALALRALGSAASPG